MVVVIDVIPDEALGDATLDTDPVETVEVVDDPLRVESVAVVLVVPYTGTVVLVVPTV